LVTRIGAVAAVSALMIVLLLALAGVLTFGYGKRRLALPNEWRPWKT
jgi:hypothetical protein